jgi:hypothetical protein
MRLTTFDCLDSGHSGRCTLALEHASSWAACSRRNLTPCSFEIHFNIILPSRVHLPSRIFPRDFPTDFCTRVFSPPPPCVLHVLPITLFSLFYDSCNICRRLQIMKLFIVFFLRPFSYIQVPPSASCCWPTSQVHTCTSFRLGFCGFLIVTVANAFLWSFIIQHRVMRFNRYEGTSHNTGKRSSC